MEEVELLAVISTTEENAILCGADGCGAKVYKRIHVIRRQSGLGIYGSTCAKKLLGSERVIDRTLAPPIRSMERLLSARDMDLLQSNTEQLLAELRETYDSMAEEAVSSDGLPNYETWTDSKLFDHCMDLARAQFHEKRGLDPDKPGWVGLLRQDADELYLKHRGLSRAGGDWADSRAYREGMLSHVKNRGNYINPYRRGAREYLDFENGWSQAQRRSV